MDAQPLYFKNKDIPSIFQCSSCLRFWKTSDSAEQCCKKGICQTCGDETASVYISKCSSCFEKDKLDKALEVLDCPNGIYFEENYYSDLEELYDHFYELLEDDPKFDFPEFVFLAKEIKYPGINIKQVIDNQMEHFFPEEDCSPSLIDVDKLVEYVNIWNSIQTLTWCDIDYTKKIKISYIEQINSI